MYGNFVEDREETIQSLQGEIPGLEDKIDKGKKAVQKAETVRKTARSLYEQDKAGELGEILSRKRSKKGGKKKTKKGRKKSKRKKVKSKRIKSKTSKKSKRRKSKPKK